MSIKRSILQSVHGGYFLVDTSTLPSGEYETIVVKSDAYGKVKDWSFTLDVKVSPTEQEALQEHENLCSIWQEKTLFFSNI